MKKNLPDLNGSKEEVTKYTINWKYCISKLQLNRFNKNNGYGRNGLLVMLYFETLAYIGLVNHHGFFHVVPQHFLIGNTRLKLSWGLSSLNLSTNWFWSFTYDNLHKQSNRSVLRGKSINSYVVMHWQLRKKGHSLNSVEKC